MSCTDIIETSEIAGSAKGNLGCFTLGKVVVALDSGNHSQAQNAVSMEIVNESDAGDARAADELTPESAKKLAEIIRTTQSRGIKDGILRES